MALIDTIQKVQGKGNDIRRRLMLPENVRCFLLKSAGETQKLESVKELTTGWNIRFNEYRGALVLEIGDPNFSRDTIAQTSFIAYGAPINEKMDVYKIDPTRIDVYEPTVKNPFWKIYASRDMKRRYILEVEEESSSS